MALWDAATVINNRNNRQSFKRLDSWAEKMQDFDATPINEWTPDRAVFFIQSLDTPRPRAKETYVSEDCIHRWFTQTKRQVLLAGQKLDRNFDFTSAEHATWRTSVKQIRNDRALAITQKPAESAKPIKWATLLTMSSHFLAKNPVDQHRKWLNCLRGLTLSWTHVFSACLRVGDILAVFWRDVIIENDESGVFVKITLSIHKTSRTHKLMPVKKLRQQHDAPTMCPLNWLQIYKEQFPHLSRPNDQIGTNHQTGTVITAAKLTAGWRSVARRMGMSETDIKFIRGHSGRNAGAKLCLAPALNIPVQVQRQIGDWTDKSAMSEYYTREQSAKIADEKLSVVSLHDFDKYLKNE